MQHEVQGHAWTEIEAQLLHSSQPGRHRTGRQGEARGLEVVLPRHLMVSMSVDAVVDPPEPRSLEDAFAHALAEGERAGEGAVEQRLWDHPRIEGRTSRSGQSVAVAC